MQSMRHTMSVLMMSLSWCAACTSSQTTQPASAFELLPPEVRGVRLPTESMMLSATVRWEDAHEIAYTSSSGAGGSVELRAVRTDDMRDRLIERAIVRGTEYRNLVLTTGASQVLYTAAVGLSESLLHRVEGAAPVELTSRPASAARVRHSPLGLPMMATRDGDMAAYVVRPDSVMLYHFASRTSRRLATGCAGLLGFSRDGRELLCRRGDSVSLAIVSLIDGSTRAQPWPAGVAGGSVASVFWGDGGLELMRTRGLVMDLVRARDGVTISEVAQEVFRPFEFPTIDELTWSPDGTRVAFATTWCPTASIFCPAEQYSVLIFDLRTRRTTRVASVNIAGIGGNKVGIVQLTFSPDGRRLAYVAGTLPSASLYLVNLP